jgi:AcrR family transcriptional regulator
MKRKYELKERARSQAETRQRIVRAAVDLHTSIGPARTTVSSIAERAGVQRHTVYAHFPDEHALFQACSSHWRSLHPFPNASRWVAIDEPTARLRAALGDVYGWYAEVESDLAVLTRDSAVHELTAALQEPRIRSLETARAALASGWPRRKTVRAAIGHALEFETWRSLTHRQGLSRRQAVESMVRLVQASATQASA